MQRFFVSNLLGCRPISELDYSVEIQNCEGCEVSHKYRRWHTFSVYLSNSCKVSRTTVNGTQTHHFLKGECGIYPAQQAEAIHWHEHTLAVHIHVKPDLLKKLAGLDAESKELTMPRRFCFRDRHLYQFALGLVETLISSPSNYLATIRQPLLTTLKHIAQVYLIPGNAEPYKPKLGSRHLNEILDNMHDHFAVQNDTQSLASLCNLSVRQFAHQFNAKFGTSAHDYLLRSRIENAKYAIQKNELSLPDIALENGFYDQAHFTNTFKKRTGMSPTQFAETLRI